ncbi:MAG: helix-turn-helix domain-containing protein [Pseudomonadota bacterium]
MGTTGTVKTDNAADDSSCDACKASQLFAELVTATASTTRGASEFSYAKDEEIYGEREPADYVYQVVRGAVRTYKLLSDGRRQIDAFHLPDDVFGLGSDPVHQFTAEAIVDTSIRIVRRRSLNAVAASDIRVVHDLLSMTATKLRQAEEHVLLLGRKMSMERVAAFLLEMDHRLARAGMLVLPMSRRDIADYLGLTLETVSRALSQLQEDGVIRFTGCHQRDIIIENRQCLHQLNK